MRKRFGVCVFLVLVSILALGAGKISGEIKKKTRNVSVEKEKWLRSISPLAASVPEEHREEWKRLAKDNPGFILRLCSTERKMKTVVTD